MEDIQRRNFTFSMLEHMSSQIIEYNWQNTPIEIATDVRVQLEMTWYRLVAAVVKLAQQDNIDSEKFNRAHHLYVKCKNCIQRRINEILAENEVKKIKPKSARPFQYRMPKPAKIVPSAIPMVEIPISIVVDLLRRDNSPKGREIPNFDVKCEFTCEWCSKSIKQTHFVKCSNCDTRSHFGCLRRTRSMGKRIDTIRWKCQKC